MKTMIWVLASVIFLGQGYLSVAKADSENIIFTKKAKFRIPFHYDSNEMPAQGAREVRLYMSMDQGGNWQHIKSVNPTEGKFSFEAAADGEYWFAVRTIDINGNIFPAQNGMDAGLKVVVDRMAPVLNLNVAPGGPGMVHLTWNAQDSNLDPSTLKLEYLENGSSEWQEVNSMSQASGETSWAIPEGGTVTVRGTILDQASNITRQQSRASIVASNGRPSSLPVNSRNNKPDLDDYSKPIASHTPVQQNPILVAPGNLGGNSSVPKTFSQAPLLSVRPNAHNEEHVERNPIEIKPETNSVSPKTNSNYVSGEGSDFPSVTQPRYKSESDPAPPVENKIHRSVRTNKFKIDYRVDDVGPSGVSSVVLYITQDEGKKWYRYGEDTDKTSPFYVSVPRDGLYGFALRVRSGAGLAYDPPQPGDTPEIVVLVDQTAPVAKFLPAYQGREDMTNKILIRWNATDNHLAEKPISISYSETLSGPWTDFTGWVENNGQFIWDVKDDVPPRIYLKLTVRDEAGNEAVIKTTSSVVVDMSKPTARIVDIQTDDTNH